ncbi:MAG: hypothetical protein ABSG42_06955 [Nitrospirota bacterium]
MNDRKKLNLAGFFAAARAHGDENPQRAARVAESLETRVLARIRAERERPPFFALAWRFVPIFMAAVVALGAWYYATVPEQPKTDMRTAITSVYEDSLALNFTADGDRL